MIQVDHKTTGPSSAATIAPAGRRDAAAADTRPACRTVTSAGNGAARRAADQDTFVMEMAIAYCNAPMNATQARRDAMAMDTKAA